MAVVTGMTAEAMQAIADDVVVSGLVNGSGHLILTKHDGSTIDAGSVVGPSGATGSTGPAGPAGVAPSGSIVMFAAQTPPSGWLVCDGTAVSRTTFATLFSLIGTTYGAGNGTTTFNLPNLKARYPRMDTNSANIGASGGATTHSHTTPDHDHQIEGGSFDAVAHMTILSQAAPNLFQERLTGIGGWTANIQGDTSTVGSSAGTETTGTKVTGRVKTGVVTTNAVTDNIPPYLNLNFIIKT